jgi:excisionase family DNA binding protein
MDAELLTVPEVMRRLRLSRAKVYDLIRARQLATVKIGRCRRITPTALSDCIATLAAGDDL